MPEAVSEIAIPTRERTGVRRPGHAHDPAEALGDLVDTGVLAYGPVWPKPEMLA